MLTAWTIKNGKKKRKDLKDAQEKELSELGNRVDFGEEAEKSLSLKSSKFLA